MVLPPPVVVFVEPQSSGNVGAIARVMSNLGLSDLRLVGQPATHNVAFEGTTNVDWILACGGKSVLERARVFSSLEDALFDTQLAIASTGRRRDIDSGYSRPHTDMAQALDSIREHFQKAPAPEKLRWALVIGRENDGLTEIEMSHCQTVVNIPTNPENPSMNAAMATGCLLYHWHIDCLEKQKDSETSSKKLLSDLPRNLPKRLRLPLEKQALAQEKPAGAFQITGDHSETGRSEWATVRHLEKFTRYLMETIELTDFVKYPDREAVRARIRRWTQASPIPIGELLFAFEILYHFRAKITGVFSKRGFLDNDLEPVSKPIRKF